MASVFPADYAEDRLHRYLRHWNRDKSNLSELDFDAVGWATEEERRERQKNYCQVGSNYYDPVSPLYEQGWGQSFHYAPMTPGLSIKESMTAYEKLLAGEARLEKGMRVLDLGCGLGGPARTIASLVGCNIVGITNSEWHAARGTTLNKKAGLDHLITAVHGDYLKLPFPDESFDAAYCVESLCYAPVPVEVYREIKRVLKPGAIFAMAEFTMTEKFDESIPEHRKVRNRIEFGNGVANIPWVPALRQSLKQAGFELLSEEDITFRSAPAPWYYAPAGDIWQAWKVPGWGDFWKVMKMWIPLRMLVHNIYRLLIVFGLEPKETSTLFDMMWFCTKGVAVGGKMGIFTPIYLFVLRKPGKRE